MRRDANANREGSDGRGHHADIPDDAGHEHGNRDGQSIVRGCRKERSDATEQRLAHRVVGGTLLQRPAPTPSKDREEPPGHALADKCLTKATTAADFDFQKRLPPSRRALWGCERFVNGTTRKVKSYSPIDDPWITDFVQDSNK